MELTREQGYTAALKLFSEYYQKQDASTLSPGKTNMREFGIGDFERKIKFRHMEFKDNSELKNYLSTKTPAFVSCSTAYYAHPSFRPMENKGWLGSELVFDIDATDIRLDCQKSHGTSWVCDNCLTKAKEETIKLIDEFLVPDFGFSKSDIKINFSGNRGYHIHIDNESVLNFDSNARKEISSYITGAGISFDDFFNTEEIGGGKRIKRLTGPKPSDPGWRGKIARNVIKDMEKGPEYLISTGIDKKTARNLYNKRALIEMGINNGNWDIVYIKDKAQFWSEVIKNRAVAQSDKIDENVTNDTGHMIRLPGTIHGGTGLLSKRVSMNELQSFDPMSDAIALHGETIKVKANARNILIMKGESFGPFSDEVADLPVYAAMYLFLKGAAVLSA